MALKGRKKPPRSESHKRNMSLALKGHTTSLETRKKISLALKGKPLTEETKSKISLANKGKIRSEETKRKISKGMKGNCNSPKMYPFINTSIELKVQSLLKESGIEFFTQYPIFGRPDIFIKPNIAIFCDGCYWHKCPQCGFGSGLERDKEVSEKLTEQGFKVIRLWEHQISC